MKWWRSRYVQHLEAENAELRETVKRMLNPQWRYLLYGETVAEQIEGIQHKMLTEDAPKERVKLPGRKTWADTAAQLTKIMSPEYIIEERRRKHEERLHAVNERIG